MTSFDSLKTLDIPAPTRALMAEVEACRARNAKAIADPTPRLVDHLGVQAAIDAVLCANRLEGVTVETRRAHQLAVGPAPIPQGDAERQLWNYREARRWVQRVGADAELSPDDLRRLHGTVHDRFPGDGQWRSREAASEAAELCAAYQRALKEGVSPLAAAAGFTLDLRALAPFGAANDRVALLAAQLALLKAGIGVCRFVSLERLIEASPAGWRAGRPELGAWLDYFVALVRRAYREFEAAAAPEPRMTAPGSVKKAPAPKKPVAAGRDTMTARLVAYIDGVSGRFTKGELRRACGATKHLAEKVLKRFKKEGMLRPVGRGKNAAWEKTERWRAKWER